MGCGASRIDALDFVRERYPRTLAFLELTPYSRRLADMFAANDRNNDQRLAVSEFLRALKVDRTRASIRLFSICDMDGSGALDFRELIFTIWHLCTVDARALAGVVFDIYDENQDGLIDFGDLCNLLTDCYGRDHMEKKEVKSILDRVQEMGSLNRLQFADFTRRSPQTLKQIIDVQQRVRDDTLGASAWTALEKKRLAKSDPMFRPVSGGGRGRWCALGLSPRFCFALTTHLFLPPSPPPRSAGELARPVLPHPRPGH
jgi:Ca2+-binding EF-hand superfamily protein